MSTYKYNDKTQLTEHFNVQEFRCKCGGTHDVIIDSALVNKLEQLFTALECSKIIINSGYRCANHDKNVGGNGSGQHTKGTAADIVCYDKSGNKISSKKVCCAGQDIGFGGIANIGSTYTATHVDTRTSNFWKGNEALGAAGTNSSVTSDFYKYFGLSQADVYGKAAQKKATKSITLTIDGKTYSGELTEK